MECPGVRGFIVYVFFSVWVKRTVFYCSVIVYVFFSVWVKRTVFVILSRVPVLACYSMRPLSDPSC